MSWKCFYILIIEMKMRVPQPILAMLTPKPAMYNLQDKAGVGIIDDKCQDNTVVNGVSSFFLTTPRLLLVKLRMPLKQSARNDVISCKRQRALLLFSPPLIIASRSIVCTCTKKVTQTPYVA